VVEASEKCIAYARYWVLIDLFVDEGC
jgi:hypothetical protein